MKAIKIAAAAALLMGGASFALAQTSTQTTPSGSPSQAQPGAPDQGPGNTPPSSPPSGTGGAAIGPPSDTTTPAPGNNPTGMSKEKQKSEQNDPLTGGKKN